VGGRDAGRSGTDVKWWPEASLSCCASFSVRTGRSRCGLRGTIGLSTPSSATKIPFRCSVFPNGSAGSLQFKTAHEWRCRSSNLPPASTAPRSWERLARGCSWLAEVRARPFPRFGACRKRPEIDRRNAAEGLAAVRTAMRDYVVACGGRFPYVPVPPPKELDRRIEIVAANGARSPDSHSRCHVFCRVIRGPLCRVQGRRFSVILPDGTTLHRSERHTRPNPMVARDVSARMNSLQHEGVSGRSEIQPMSTPQAHAGVGSETITE
jgi:hypothetical protein